MPFSFNKNPIRILFFKFSAFFRIRFCAIFAFVKMTISHLWMFIVFIKWKMAFAFEAFFHLSI